MHCANVPNLLLKHKDIFTSLWGVQFNFNEKKPSLEYHIHCAFLFVRKHPDSVGKHSVMSESESWLTWPPIYVMFSFRSKVVNL